MEHRRRELGQKQAGHGVKLEALDDPARHASFRHLVRDSFDAFVEAQALVLVQKCMDEFYSTRTVHYAHGDEAQALVGDNVDTGNADAVKDAVVTMSKHVFGKLRERIVKNAVLKVYSFLVVPCQSALWSWVQAAVSSLSDAELQKRFDVVASTQQLQMAEKALRDSADSFKATRAEISAAATQYTSTQ